MPSETITILKDEYIALLRCKAELAECRLAATEAPQAFVPRGKPHSWMSAEEEAEILRLHQTGLRSSEIGKRVGRPHSTVRRCIARLRSEDRPA